MFSDGSTEISSSSRLRAKYLLKCGYLLKLDRHATVAALQWRRVFVVLADELSFYDNEAAFESDSHPRGVCRLDCYTVMQLNPPVEPFEFSIFTHHASNARGQPSSSSQSQSYVFTFRALSEDELTCWCKLLNHFPECV